jgi:hypothetical protein
VLRDRGKHFAELLRPRERLGELGEVLELAHALARLLVEARVLDRAADERRRRREELDLLRVNSRGASVCIVIAPMTSPSRRERDGEERLELLLLELGTNLLRGSSIAFCVKAGSPCSTAHQAMPSPLSSVDLPARSAYGSERRASTSRSSSIR